MVFLANDSWLQHQRPHPIPFNTTWWLSKSLGLITRLSGWRGPRPQVLINCWLKWAGLLSKFSGDLTFSDKVIFLADVWCLSYLFHNMTNIELMVISHSFWSSKNSKRSRIVINMPKVWEIESFTAESDTYVKALVRSNISLLNTIRMIGTEKIVRERRGQQIFKNIWLQICIRTNNCMKSYDFTYPDIQIYVWIVVHFEFSSQRNVF